MDSLNIFQQLAVSLLPLLLALTVPMIVQARVALALGDTTGKQYGRTSLNPLSHADPIGTLVVPGVMIALGNLAGSGGGLLIGWATIFRLGMRTRLPLADATPELPLWQHRASRLSQLAMYLLLLSLPVLGWLLTNARGQPVVLPGLGSLPVLLERDLDVADTLQLVHTWTAWILVSMVALHVGAAVWHHRIRRDGVLTAMWPGLRSRT